MRRGGWFDALDADPVAAAASLPDPVFHHLRRMTGPLGIWEHALFTDPRHEHGLCVDDNARALILLARQPDLAPELNDLAGIYMRFLQDSSLVGGGFHNRRRRDGSWADRRGSDDSQGRAMWALGAVFRSRNHIAGRDAALNLFRRQALSSVSPRANAFVILGAAEIIAREPANGWAYEVIDRSAAHLRIRNDPRWPWPEARLAYDNPRIPEAMVAAGAALGSEGMLTRGLGLLDWLVSMETRGSHFSFTPAGGWSPGDERPGFDQQPLEAAAFADACSRAWRTTGELHWRDHVIRAASWFLGANDSQITIYDAETGGGYDGLTSHGRNRNQGAESTIAALSALQQAKLVTS